MSNTKPATQSTIMIASAIIAVSQLYNIYRSIIGEPPIVISEVDITSIATVLGALYIGARRFLVKHKGLYICKS